jgi:large subunit ribosomal protein L5
MNNLKSWHKNILKIDSVYKANFVNSLQIPKIDKITINISSKSIIENPKSILYYVIALKLISNQNPIICKAKKSIALFKIRKGMIIGTKVTLRNEFSYNFLSLFIPLVLPNLKKLKSFSVTKGSLSIGIRELLIFPQLNEYYDRFPKNISGIINISLDTQKTELSKIVFSSFQIPIKQ